MSVRGPGHVLDELGICTRCAACSCCERSEVAIAKECPGSTTSRENAP